MAYTAQTAVRKPVARLFVLPTVMTDAQCNSSITSGTAPSGGWVQLYTADGGVVYNQERTTTDLVSQQKGVEATVVEAEPASITMTLRSASLNELIDLMSINTASTGDGLSGIGLRENRGSDLADTALSFFFYDKSLDETNETNTPNITAASQSNPAYLIFKAVPTSPAQVTYNNVQNTATMTFRCLSSASTGSAAGYYGRAGKFTLGA